MENTFLILKLLSFFIFIIPIGILFIVSLGILPDVVEQDLKKFNGLKGFVKHYFIIEESNSLFFKILDGTISIFCISYMLFVYGVQKVSFFLLLLISSPILLFFGLYFLVKDSKNKSAFNY